MVVVKLEHVIVRMYFILSSMIFVFVFQYDLMVGVYFFLIGYDLKVSHLLGLPCLVRMKERFFDSGKAV